MLTMYGNLVGYSDTSWKFYVLQFQFGLSLNSIGEIVDALIQAWEETLYQTVARFLEHQNQSSGLRLLFSSRGNSSSL